VMRKKMKFKWPFILLGLVIASGCSSISLTQQGKTVRVHGAHGVADCKSIGKTTVTVTDKVAGLQRKEHVIKSELETLARNAAANMDGDTIVPSGKIRGGKQIFNVYKCRGR